MHPKHIYAAVMLSAPLWLTGCESGIPNPVGNPPPRERAEVVVDNYEKYDAIPLARKTILLNEGFDNNTRGWTVGSGTDYTMAVAGGELYIGTVSTARQSTISVTDLKETDNFEIEARLRNFQAVSSNGGTALIWGSSTGSAYFFRGNPYSGTIEIGRETRTAITESGFMNGDMYKVLTVRKVKHLYYYFINGTYISKEMVNSFYGPSIGFEGGRNTNTRIDYLKVSRLTL